MYFSCLREENTIGGIANTAEKAPGKKNKPVMMPAKIGIFSAERVNADENPVYASAKYANAKFKANRKRVLEMYLK